MAFTAGELANIANAALDFYIKKQPFLQTIQDKPLLDAMTSAKKTFPGGKGNVDLPVKGDYTSAMVGYTHDDTVTYANPANIKRVFYPWKEEHCGIVITGTELKINGTSVTDSTTGENTTNHDQAEMTRLVNLLEDKLEDMGEGTSRSLNSQLWGDGTADPKALAGVKAFITTTPNLGLTGGLDRATVTWWRNRAPAAIQADLSDQTLTKTLRAEVRQLRRYGGKPSLLLAGSGFLADLEAEVFEKGVYTQTGFVNNGKNDIGMADISMRGVGTFQYDPTLDDLSQSRYCYFIDPKHLYLYAMDGEWMKQHAPARPENKYVYYRAVTITGVVAADQLNCHGVYQSIAAVP
jgi:hypothetical protein